MTGNGDQESDDNEVVPSTIPTSFLHKVVQHSRDDGEGEIVRLSPEQNQQPAGDGEIESS